ncbi:MAG: LysE family translocator [Desulfobacula sp.]|jgi:threonine/homoserine/homoserine lactone efflux protein|nr:LysE family translocator [Desulfobacula sp.]MBT7260186.1 LysE family translocator [Desulfobacula sp.]
MFGIENYTGFIIAAIILNLTPGIDTIYILTRSISQGKNAGLVSVAGIMSGCIVHVLCAAFGLSLILSTSAFVFTMIKWAGAFYLIYLGVKTLLKKSTAFESSLSDHAVEGLVKIYKQGVLTNVLNPKVGLFFLSFLPQFINPDKVNGPMPFLMLGATFLVTGTIWCLILTWTAALMTTTLRNNQMAGTLLQKLSGLIFIGFGLKLAFNK